jgi:ubiquinone/menaquinone biosynthesis C-methylase UbiE
MISVARRRSEGLRNVSFSTCTGMDLRGFDDESFDLVFAVDSFPYLVQSGMALVRTHFAEAARVLRANGELVILNFAYGTDASNDCDDVAALATAHGFEVLVAGTTPFALWNGTAFRLRRRAAGSSGSRSRR